MFTIRPYEERDATACGECLHESFFICPVEDCDLVLLRDYAQVLIEKLNFTYVAETEDHKVVGFISGYYNKRFSKKLAASSDTKRHYGLWCWMFLKYYLKGYKMSAPFKTQFEAFIRQAQERDAKDFEVCDLELMALASRRDYRRGLGTALLARFMERGRDDGADCIRLFTNTHASWEFYEKRGFTKVSERPISGEPGELSLVYELKLSEIGG